ncbi:MAG: CopG family transcriptional regulator [Coriobacteriales bacterium]|nr:CopG family transcriptional regulator [Coriobacteriales bacterium]
MSELRRSTIYLEPELHQALRLKAAQTDCSLSELVNDAVRLMLAEDAEDLAAFEDRADEPLVALEDAVAYLERNGDL